MANIEDFAAEEPRSITDGPFGSNLKTAHYTEHGPRVIRLQNIGDGRFIDEPAHISEEHYDKLKAHSAEAGDVVVASLGNELPRACTVPSWLGPAIVKADCIRLRPAEDVDGRYVMYMLNAPQSRDAVKDLIHGVGRPRLGLRVIRNIEIPRAPLDEQQRIVETIEEQFSRLDAGVESLQRAKRNLVRFRAAVLKAGVEGRLTGTSTSRWPVVSLEEVTSLIRNGVFVSRPDQDTSGFPIFRISAVRPMSLNLDDIRFAHGLDPDTVGKYTVREGDLLYTRYSGQPEYVGACAMMPSGAPRALHPDKLIRVVVDQEAVLPGFVELASSTGPSLEFIRSRRRTTAGQTGIAGRDLKQMPLPLPPVSEQSRIVEEVQRHLSFVDVLEAALESSIRKSRSLRRSILQAAFEGQLCNSLVRRQA